MNQVYDNYNFFLIYVSNNYIWVENMTIRYGMAPISTYFFALNPASQPKHLCWSK